MKNHFGAVRNTLFAAAILMVSFLMVAAFFYAKGIGMHFTADGKTAIVPSYWRLYIEAIGIVYAALLWVISRIFRLIPYGGWIIDVAGMMIAVTLQNFAVWGGLRLWSRPIKPC